jgi:hypothetical protein
MAFHEKSHLALQRNVCNAEYYILYGVVL